jgi:hypothetical protein
VAERARAILAIPSTSAPSERVFSTAGLLLSSKRGRLEPELCEEIIFLHGYYKFLERNNNNN